MAMGRNDALVEISCIEPQDILPTLFLLFHLHSASSISSYALGKLYFILYFACIIIFNMIFTVYVYRSCKSGNSSKAFAPVFVRQSEN